MVKKYRKYVLLDRDGTIIVDKHYQKDPALTELLPNARAGLDKLRDAGFGLIMVSNQSGIGRGYFTRADLAGVNRSVIALLGGGDGYFAGIYYCPHTDNDNCRCRKPRPGLAEAASLDHGFTLSDCYVVGDSARDIAMGDEIVAATILVRTGNGLKTERAGEVTPDYVADDLLDAANWIVEQEKKEKAAREMG